MFRKSSCIVLALLMMVTVFAACSSTPAANTPAATTAPAATTPGTAAPAPEVPAVDTSKHVNLVMYMTGSTTPRDMDMVVAELNKYTEKELNASLEFNIFNDPNTAQKMTMLLASGEPIDLIYAAGWITYSQFVNKNAYLPLDDIVPVASPALQNYVSEEMWDATRVGGNIYMVPCMWPEWTPYGFLWREDLRKQYDLPEVKDMETFEAYMQGIRDNDPAMVVSGERILTQGQLGTYFSAWEVLDEKYKWADWRVPYGLYIPYEKPAAVENWYESDSFKTDMEMFKRWADAGFWSKSALATTEAELDAFKAGKIVTDVALNSPQGYAALVSEMSISQPEWEIGWWPFHRNKKLSVANHATQNGFAVPITSQNPERAIMLLERLILDKEFHLLSQYGIEGTHYTLDANGFYEYVGDPANSGFGREAARLWATRNTEFMLYPANTYEIVQSINAELSTYTYPNIWTGFTENADSYQAERAAFLDVQAQYLPAIQAGLVDNIDAAIEELVAKSKVAGLDKIREEYTKQWIAYLDDKGYGETVVK